MESWPDSSYTPFRGSKGTTWEGGIRVPGIFYWKGMIEPGTTSDGLFDFCDILPTFCAIAGIENLPEDRFIDGVDQRAFLLAEPAPEGTHWGADPAWMSNRIAIHSWLLDNISATRVGPWKMMGRTTEPDIRDSVNPGGFSGHDSMMTYGKVFNLFLDPKEEHSVTIRKLVYMPLIGAINAAHMKSFEKYPPRIQVKGGESV